jgi:hypothetical protein
MDLKNYNKKKSRYRQNYAPDVFRKGLKQAAHYIFIKIFQKNTELFTVNLQNGMDLKIL